MKEKVVRIFIIITMIIIAVVPVTGIDSLELDNENKLSPNGLPSSFQNFSVNIIKPIGFYFFDLKMPIKGAYNLVIGPITIEAYCTIDEIPVDRAEFHIYNMFGKEVINETIYQPEKPTLYCLWPDIAFFKHTIEVIIFDDQNNSAYDRINIWKFL